MLQALLLILSIAALPATRALHAFPDLKGNATAAASTLKQESLKQWSPSMAFSLSSSSFQNGSDIPKQFTCSGADISPGLKWSNPPAGTKTFALIADDPDAPAGTWTHWLVYDLPPQTAALQENLPKTDDIPSGGKQGRNDFRKIGYGGPCPPPGKPHRYFFKLYALDEVLNLKPAEDRRQLEQAMKGHVLGQAELMGKFDR